MTDFQKTLYVADAICDCIPLVSTVTNVSEALYKLAHRVDAVSPVTPGRATSLKIHVLHKDLLDCCVGAIPLFGNVVRLLQLVIRALRGSTICDPLHAAIVRDNQELLHLSLGNRALTPEEAGAMLSIASAYPNPETVRKILRHSDDFTAEVLILNLNPQQRADASTAAKATAILDRWDVLGRQLPGRFFAIPTVLSAARPFLDNHNPSLASRILGILPENSLSLRQAQPFLDNYDNPDLTPAQSLNADQYSSLLLKLTTEAASQLAASPDTPLHTLQRLLALRQDLDKNLLIGSLFPSEEAASLEKQNKARSIFAYLEQQPDFTAAPAPAIPALCRLLEAGESDFAGQLLAILPKNISRSDISNCLLNSPNRQTALKLLSNL